VVDGALLVFSHDDARAQLAPVVPDQARQGVVQLGRVDAVVEDEKGAHPSAAEGAEVIGRRDGDNLHG
jgi:hypothetical protein